MAWSHYPNLAHPGIGPDEGSDWYESNIPPVLKPSTPGSQLPGAPQHGPTLQQAKDAQNARGGKFWHKKRKEWWYRSPTTGKISPMTKLNKQQGLGKYAKKPSKSKGKSGSGGHSHAPVSSTPYADSMASSFGGKLKVDQKAINKAVNSILSGQIGPLDKERKRVKAQEKAQRKHMNATHADLNKEMAKIRGESLSNTQDLISLAANTNDHRAGQGAKNAALVSDLFGGAGVDQNASELSDAIASGDQRGGASMSTRTGENLAAFMDMSRSAAASGHAESLNELARESRNRRRELTDEINAVHGQRGQLAYELRQQALDRLMKQQAAAQAFGFDVAQLGLQEKQLAAQTASKAGRDYDWGDVQHVLNGKPEKISRVVADADGNPKTVTETVYDGGAATKKEALDGLISIGVPRKDAKRLVNEWYRQKAQGVANAGIDQLKKIFDQLNKVKKKK